MNTYTDKNQEKKSQSIVNKVQKQKAIKSTFQFIDNRPEAVIQRKLQETANNSPQAKQAAQLQSMADNYTLRNSMQTTTLQKQKDSKSTFQFIGTQSKDMPQRKIKETGNGKSVFQSYRANELPIQMTKKGASVTWGVTHVVEIVDDSLFGGENPLDNELPPSLGGQLMKGDKLVIDDAPVLISRRGANQEKVDKRTEDAKGNTVSKWVRVLKIIPIKGIERDLSDKKMYVRKETISIEEKSDKKPFVKNNILLENIKDWEGEGIPEKLREISEKWKNRGKLRRTKSKGVLDIDKKDMKETSEGGMGKPSGRNWDQEDEGVEVAMDMAKENHEPFDEEKGQWRIKAVNKDTGELVGVLIVEDAEPLYLRWLIGNPEIKGGGSALLAAVKKLLLQEDTADSIEVDSAYSAKDAYTKSGFKVTNKEEVSPGDEFKLSLTMEDSDKMLKSIPKEYKDFKPKKYPFEK